MLVAMVILLKTINNLGWLSDICAVKNSVKKTMVPDMFLIAGFEGAICQ